MPKPAVCSRGTGMTATVASACAARWVSRRVRKSIWKSWSPERISTSLARWPRRWCRLWRTASAVPWNQEGFSSVCSAARMATKASEKWSNL